MLARVFAGLALAITFATPVLAQSNAELSVRLDRAEAQARSLAATVADLLARVAALEARIAELEAAAAAPPAPVARTQAPATQTAVATQPVTAGIVSSPLPAPPAGFTGGVPATVPSAPPPPAAVPGAPLDLSSLIRGDGTLNITNTFPVASAPQTAGSPDADYQAAYDAFLRADYRLAESLFRAFTSAYPTHPLVPDARFWIAESLYSQGLFRDAETAFVALYNSNPTSLRAPEIHLKVALARMALGQTVQACSDLQQVLTYPSLSNSVRQRANRAMSDARC